jgi:hypothetical protein
VAANCWVFPDVRLTLVGETATETPVLTVTVALAFLVESAELAAVTVTVVLLLTVGAVNNPPLEIEPAVADQVTAVLVVPWTVAVNCCVLPDPTLALVGETATVIAGVTVTDALAFLVVSAALVAVTVTLVLLLTEGAVNSPLLETEPAVADQVTDVLVVP